SSSTSPSPPPIISPLSLHDALPICHRPSGRAAAHGPELPGRALTRRGRDGGPGRGADDRGDLCVRRDRGRLHLLPGIEQVERARSEEHTSELQSPYDLVCRLLLEKK